MTTPLDHAIEQWQDVNFRIAEASGIGHLEAPDPYLLATLLDSRAALWLELSRLRHHVAAERGGATDAYAVACHYAAILDQEQAAEIRFVHRIPTLHPGTAAAHLGLKHARCEHCGRPWQLGKDRACEKCPALLWGVSPASADEVGKYPPGEPWWPPHTNDEG